MNLFTSMKVAAVVVVVTLQCLAARTSAAIVPETGRFVDDVRGDSAADQMVGGGELGDATVFPIDRAIDYHTHRSYQLIGAADDGIANDWTLHMTNLSGQSWTNLFFVADAGATIGNADGTIEDIAQAPGVTTDAFHIDAAGVNANLLWESGAADGIFSPGEEWEFAITNFGTGAFTLPPELITPGIFAASPPMVSLGGTNASFLASPVPEPGALPMLGALAGVLLL